MLAADAPARGVRKAKRRMIMMRPSSDIAFTPRIKALQTERGSRETYARIEQRGGFRTGITEELAAFLADIDTAYLGSGLID